MKVTKKVLTEKEKELLRKTIGSELISIDGVLVAPPDHAWNTFRLHFADFALDINVNLGEVIVDEFGALEEFGLMTVTDAPQNVLDIPEASPDTTTFGINQKVVGVTIFNDIAEIFGDGLKVADLRYPQAVAFTTETESIMIDKEVWFSEMPVIKRGENAEEMLYDESVNWEDSPEEDPTTHYEFRVEIEEL